MTRFQPQLKKELLISGLRLCRYVLHSIPHTMLVIQRGVSTCAPGAKIHHNSSSSSDLIACKSERGRTFVGRLTQPQSK